MSSSAELLKAAAKGDARTVKRLLQVRCASPGLSSSLSKPLV